MNAWTITDTQTLIGLIEQIKQPASYLVDIFFPDVMPVSYTTYVSAEYVKQGRLLAPYIVPGARAVNISRSGSVIKSYKAPLVGVRRTLSLTDIEQRMIGETPIYSTMTPQDRAAATQARDLVELIRMVRNRMNAQAADILQTGGAIIKGFADDGVTAQVDTIQFDWDGTITPATHWDNANATIYADLKNASEAIQEECGVIPTIAVCGKNVETYLLKNKEIKEWLMIPNVRNLSLMNLEPRYLSPQVRFIGYIASLNLELVSYAETYTDADGVVKPFVAADNVILGNVGLGKQLYGAITLLDQGGAWQTYAAQYAPQYNFNVEAQSSSLSVFSRFLMVPNDVGSWKCLKTCG